MKGRQILNLTKESFEKYGDIIAFSSRKSDGFEIVIESLSEGWRIALLEFTKKSTGVLENHPTSKETFEPMLGVVLILVAQNESPEDFEVFLLDKPLCVNAGIWHQVITLSEYAKVKITENLHVSCEYYNLKSEFHANLLA